MRRIACILIVGLSAASPTALAEDNAPLTPDEQTASVEQARQSDWKRSVDSLLAQSETASALAGDCGQCSDCCDGIWPRWTLEAGSLFLWRNSPSVPLDGGVGPLITARLQT